MSKTACPVCGKKAFYRGLNYAYCFVCGHQEKVEQSLRYDYPVEDIARVYEQFYQECLLLPSEARDFLHRRGFSDKAMNEFGLLYCPTFIKPRAEYVAYKLVNKRGEPYLADRIIIPYFYGKSIYALRGRDFRGKDPKYKSNPSVVKKTVFYPYNWTSAVERADEQKRIIVTEGEFKAISAHDAGYPICAVPGVTVIPPGMMFKKDWKVILAFDNEHNIHVVRALYRIAQYFRSVFIAVLPKLGRAKMDIDELLRLGRRDLFDLALEQALPARDYFRLVGV